MIPELHGKVFRSQPMTFTVGSEDTFDLHFLKRAMRRMNAPEVAQIALHLKCTMSGDAGSVAFAGEDAYKALDVEIKDAGGTTVDVSGCQLRILEQMDRGTRQFDPAAVATNATNTLYENWWWVDYEPEKEYRIGDYRVPLLHFVEGGELNVTMRNPPNGLITSGVLRAYFRVIDNRQRELKSRMILRERLITADEDQYPVGGSTRNAWVSSVLNTTPGYTSLAGYTALDSDTLDWPAGLYPEWTEHDYRRTRPDFNAGDEVIAENALVFVKPEVNQRIGRMPDIDSMHLDFNTTYPSSGKLITQYIEDRHGGLAAEWMGYDSVADLVRGIHDKGRVVSKGKADSGATKWDPALMRRLPVRIG